MNVCDNEHAQIVYDNTKRVKGILVNCPMCTAMNLLLESYKNLDGKENKGLVEEIQEFIKEQGEYRE